MSCADNPCKNNANCVDLQCANCGFRCDCVDDFVGPLCNVHRKCFADARLCYQTDYEKRSYESATAHCLRQGGITKPVILNRMEQESLRSYVQHKMITGSIWLAAEARQNLVNKDTKWLYFDGLETSKRKCFTARRKTYNYCAT